MLLQSLHISSNEKRFLIMAAWLTGFEKDPGVNDINMPR